jgi:hypothetical protein
MLDTESMNATHHLERTAARPRRRWWKRLLLVSLSLLLLLIGGIVGWVKWVEYVAEKELQAVIAELDETDPGWRLEDIEAARKVIPDVENSALVVMQIAGKIPRPVPPAQTDKNPPKDWEQRVFESSPEEELEPDIYWELRNELKSIQPLLKQARSLARMKEGRAPISYSLDFISTPLKHVQDAQDVAYLLRKDLLVRARQHDIDGALESARAALVAGRSIGDEPITISQLTRINFDYRAAWNVERALAQGRAAERILDGLQRLLAEEESTPHWLIALRGERAGNDVLLRALEDGKLPPGWLSGRTGSEPSNPITDPLESMTARIQARLAHPVVLRMLTESIRTAQLPPEQQTDEFKIREQEARNSDLPALATLLVSGTLRMAESDIRRRATLRSAIVALAAERFRQANGRWPKDVAELIPAYLKEAPLDPYDGKPIRLRAVPKGLLVYSIGPDRQDNGGTMDRRNPGATGQNIVFQLWNVEARRKPALNPDVGPPQATEEELQMMRWQMPPVQRDAPPEKPKLEGPPR